MLETPTAHLHGTHVCNLFKGAPLPVGQQQKPETASAAVASDEECNGNEESGMGVPLIKMKSPSNTSPKDGLDPNNKMESLHEESFSVKVKRLT